MKKKLGILGFVVIATTMFFSFNFVVKSTNDSDNLASLIVLNSANAESDGEGWFWQSRTENCEYTVTISILPFGIGGERTDTYYGTRRVCDDGWSLCWSSICS